MLGASLSSALAGKAPSEMSALKPYLGKRAVRNFREGDGDNGIIRSPFQRHHSTRPGDHNRLWFRFVFAASLPKSSGVRYHSGAMPTPKQAIDGVDSKVERAERHVSDIGELWYPLN